MDDIKEVAAAEFRSLEKIRDRAHRIKDALEKIPVFAAREEWDETDKTKEDKRIVAAMLAHRIADEMLDHHFSSDAQLFGESSHFSQQSSGVKMRQIGLGLRPVGPILYAFLISDALALVEEVERMTGRQLRSDG